MYLTRNRLVVSLAGLGVLTLAAACGGVSTAGGSQYGAPIGNAAGPGQGTTNSSTVSVQTVDGGKRLVSPTGAVLYTNDQDSSGKPKCASRDCTAIWVPLTVSAGQQVTAAPGVSGTISTVSLPNGKDQVTLNSKPLYTFALDAQPGQVHGDGVGDTFDGTHFTWHSAAPAGTAPANNAPANNAPGY